MEILFVVPIFPTACQSKQFNTSKANSVDMDQSPPAMKPCSVSEI